MGHVGAYQSNWQNSNSSAEAVWSHQSFMAQSSGLQQTQGRGRTDSSNDYGGGRGGFSHSRTQINGYSSQSSGSASYHNPSSNSYRGSGLVNPRQVEDTWGNIG